MIKIHLDCKKGETNVEAIGLMEDIVVETVATIRHIYEAFSRADENAGEAFKKFVREAVNDENGPMWKDLD